jgi:hypothetical protein
MPTLQETTEVNGVDKTTTVVPEYGQCGGQGWTVRILMPPQLYRVLDTCLLVCSTHRDRQVALLVRHASRNQTMRSTPNACPLWLSAAEI